MTENPLGYEKISKLLKNFAVPSIVASLVGSIYNIVDQIFIGQGVGYLGNAATNVAYPFSTICLAIALLVGIGSASRVSLCLGRKEPKAAAKAAGNGIVLMGIFGIIYLLVGETFLPLLLWQHTVSKHFRGVRVVLNHSFAVVMDDTSDNDFLKLLHCKNCIFSVIVRTSLLKVWHYYTFTF